MCFGFLLFVCFWFFYIGVYDYHRLLLGGILSVSDTPEWLLRLQNVTAAYIKTGVSGKWVEFQLW